MTRTGLVTSPLFESHDTGPGHPERSARLRAVLERLEASGTLQELAREDAREAELEPVARVHDPAYLERVRAEVQSGASFVDAGDTAVCPVSFSAALAATGGLLQAVDRVQAGAWRNAFVAARPPGHHAERDRAMGFCLVNHVAVAARHLQHEHGLKRVAILDWDVHHGNGTQHLFEDDASVFYASVHQYPHYPGTGAAGERGRGAGEGATLNCPLPAGSTDADYLRTFETRVLPGLEAFDPQFLILSAGFDAHRADPLSETLVTEAGFAEMTRLVMGLAEARCSGKLVSLLEGGYDLEALASSVETHVSLLTQ